ncbi:uncharacterized protein LOC121592389 isoform X2 [Anopheles merus]|uniref:uncharacterized protein LOC121592389 isoform X2 n=1 Tax=Anopheles merus TaxID=30066 RepID=UPI001BE43C56|nr:uncharacterized protein LOC121592389 isoform X2 [Anopheles merus]
MGNSYEADHAAKKYYGLFGLKPTLTRDSSVCVCSTDSRYSKKSAHQLQRKDARRVHKLSITNLCKLVYLREKLLDIVKLSKVGITISQSRLFSRLCPVYNVTNKM